jgi:hypothetical protein
MVTKGSLLKIMSASLGFVGSLILFKFGIPQMIDTGGHSTLVVSQADETEKQKIIVYRRWSRLGLAMIALSFILQLIEELVIIKFNSNCTIRYFTMRYNNLINIIFIFF